MKKQWTNNFFFFFLKGSSVFYDDIDYLMRACTMQCMSVIYIRRWFQKSSVRLWQTKLFFILFFFLMRIKIVKWQTKLTITIITFLCFDEKVLDFKIKMEARLQVASSSSISYHAIILDEDKIQNIKSVSFQLPHDEMLLFKFFFLLNC